MERGARYLVSLLALAALSYWSIEEPFLRMRRGYGGSHTAPMTTAA